MDATPPTGLVEQFHLLFLAQLARRVKPALFVLKGGCNLRFFHKSVRYSEDMDLDLGEIGTGAFRDEVRELLASRPFAQVLEARGVAIERVSEPKQTDTTQRWKLGLRVQGAAVPLPTKIECSRRGLEDGVVLGSVDPIVARAYRLPPFMVNHYDGAAALRQKIGALAGRRETQARDVFDLHHLLAGGATLRASPERDGDVVERARANALTVDFGTFKSQVLAYLEPEAQAQYDSPSAWDTIVLEVVEALRGARS
jgi:predicted nucleotidyltransferase component of viral defense system